LSRFDRRELAAVFAGGAIGTLARVWLGLHLASGPTHWPWTIFAINVSGSFALAYLATRLQERLPPSTYRRPFLATGLCGGYTTFSTVQVEAVHMLQAHCYGLTAGYLAASVAAGLTAVWLGTTIVRRAPVL
jgi:fluoride exporter